MKYGYVRSSTNKNSEIEKQIEVLLSMTENVIIENDGDMLDGLLKRLEKNDTIHVSHIDRLLTNNPAKAKPILIELLEKDVKVFVDDKEIDLQKLLNLIK